MTKSEAHQLLDAIRVGYTYPTDAEVYQALVATGDLRRGHLTIPHADEELACAQ